MSKELLLVMEAVANEKGVPRAVIIEAMEAALASAAPVSASREPAASSSASSSGSIRASIRPLARSSRRC